MYFVFHFVAAKRNLCHVLAELSLCSYNFGIMTQSVHGNDKFNYFKIFLSITMVSFLSLPLDITAIFMPDNCSIFLIYFFAFSGNFLNSVIPLVLCFHPGNSI